jgi:hypothetical protein
VSASDARILDCLDFSLKKPEVWFTMVEALFEEGSIAAPKRKYNKVLYRLPVSFVESLVLLINTIGDYPDREYQELKMRVLAAHGAQGGRNWTPC